MLIALIRLFTSVVAVAAVAGHHPVAQDQVVSPPAAVANQATANPEADPKEVLTRVLRKVHAVHLDDAKLEDNPSSRHPDSL